MRHARNQGLARSFHDGVDHALELGADIVVNTDGDNQYPQERIADLVQPIVARRGRHRHRRPAGAPGRALLAGQEGCCRSSAAAVVNKAAGTDLPDAASGFRAYSRESLMRLNTITRFSYCMETIIQAGNKRLTIASVPVETNAKTRESRLFKSTRQHVFKSAAAIIRAYIMYKPYVIFGWLTALFGVLGLRPVRPLRRARWPSATTAATSSRCSLGRVLLILAFLSVMLGIISDLIRTNRILIETTLEHTKKARFGSTTSQAGDDRPAIRAVRL